MNLDSEHILMGAPSDLVWPLPGGEGLYKEMTEERIISYLLKELPDADMERFEEECFGQEEWPAQVEVVEDELIESYLCNGLTPERRQRFERHYLITPARQERVMMEAALLRYAGGRNAAPQVTDVPAAPGPKKIGIFSIFRRASSKPLRMAAAAAVVALIAGALWFFFLRTPSPL